MTRTIRLFLLLAAVALIAAACSADAGGPGVATLESQSPEDGASPSPSAATDPNEAFLAYAACMRENGVDMPDPEIVQDGGGSATGQRPAVGFRAGADANIDDEEFAEADEACRHHLDSIVTEGQGPQLTPEEEEALLAFAQCMRENGVDMPDPGSAGGFIRVGPGDAEFDPETFEAAQEACEHLMPFSGDGDKGPRINVEPGGGPGTDEDQ